MTAKSSTRSDPETNAPVFAIEIDGVDVVQHGPNVLSVTVDLSLDSFGGFSIVFGGNAGSPKGLGWIDSDLFTVGRKVSIKMGCAPNRLTTMIVGEISNIRANFPSDGASSVEIIGDDSVSFSISKKRRKKTITMRYGNELLSFSPEIDRSQIGGEIVNDLANKGIGSLSATKNEKKMRSRLVLDRIQKETIIGIGECVGYTEVVPGRTLRLEGLGDKFSGPYQVTGSIYSVDSSLAYRMTFMVTTK